MSKYKKLLKKYTKAVNSNPNNIKAWYYKGILLSSINRKEEALYAFNKVSELDTKMFALTKNDVEEVRKIKLLFFDNPDIESMFFMGTIEKLPENYNEWINRATAFEYLKYNSDAYMSYSMALYLEPSHYKVWFFTGNYLLRRGCVASAMEAFNTAIRIHSKDAAVWYNKAIIYCYTKEFRNALKSFFKVVKIKKLYTPFYIFNIIISNIRFFLVLKNN